MNKSPEVYLLENIYLLRSKLEESERKLQAMEVEREKLLHSLSELTREAIAMRSIISTMKHF